MDFVPEKIKIKLEDFNIRMRKKLLWLLLYNILYDWKRNVYEFKLIFSLWWKEKEKRWLCKKF